MDSPYVAAIKGFFGIIARFFTSAPPALVAVVVVIAIGSTIAYVSSARVREAEDRAALELLRR